MSITCYYQHFVAIYRKYDWAIYVVTDNTESVLGIRPHSEHLVEKYTQRLCYGWWNRNLSYQQVAFQSNANHPLAESMGYIKSEGMWIFYFDLDVTFTLMCDLDLINDL